MPSAELSTGATIAYEVTGSGFPVLLFAPGGMRSAMSFWESAEWNPVAELSSRFSVVAMDQRNAGASTAPVTADDGWATYTADHLALMDHLGFEQFHVIGGCIGGPYCLGTIQAAPDRVASAVLQQTIGTDNNRDAFYDMFDSWATPLAESRDDIDPAVLPAFRSNMYDHEFILSVDRDFVAACHTPMLVLMGDDLYHPQSTSREVADLAPNATLIEHWKAPDEIEGTVTTVREFLRRHTPA